jgi:alanine racemase
MLIIDSLKNLIKAKYPTLNRLEIIADNLLENLDFLQKFNDKLEIIPVLKANAYGHGLKEVAKILNQTKLKRVAVDSFPESQIVNRYFKGKVLLIGEMSNKSYSYLSPKKTEFVVYNLETLKNLANFNRNLKVHLFFNSGMNREGIKDIKEFIKVGKEYLKKVSVIGFCSHLASAEEDEKLNNWQANNFFSALDYLNTQGYQPKIIHLANSAGLFTLNNERLNAARVGLSFYGYHNFNNDSVYYKILEENLKPALRVISKVVSVYQLKAKEIVSYNSAYITEADNCQIVTIPFGYCEGLSFSLLNSNYKAQIRTKDKLVEVELVGRVSMNLSSWRVLGDEKIMIGDELIIVSNNKNQPNNIVNLATKSQTIIYETLIRFKENIRRYVV